MDRNEIRNRKFVVAKSCCIRNVSRMRERRGRKRVRVNIVYRDIVFFIFFLLNSKKTNKPHKSMTSGPT